MTIPFDRPKRRRKRGKRGGVKHRLRHQRETKVLPLPVVPVAPIIVASLRARLHSLSQRHRKAG